MTASTADGALPMETSTLPMATMRSFTSMTIERSLAAGALMFVLGCSEEAVAPKAAGGTSSSPAPTSSTAIPKAEDAGGTTPPDDDGGTQTGTPVAQHGALKVANGKIVGKNGERVVLSGMSLFWSQWGSAFWNPGAVKTLREGWGSTVVRAAMGIESGGYLEDATREKNRVITVVDAAIAQGMYVIVDWHDHNADQHLEQAKTFFSAMADAYGSSPNVIFEVWNEPIEVSWSTVKTYANTVTATIRARGAKNLVIVGSPHWSQDVDLAANDPVADTNTAYTIHFYANTAAHQAPLRTKAKAALDKGLALFATEWGTSSADGNGAVNEVESQAWLDFLKTHDISWCNWSLFDKPEAASALVPGASPTGPWEDTALTPSGRFVKAKLK